MEISVSCDNTGSRRLDEDTSRRNVETLGLWMVTFEATFKFLQTKVALNYV